VKSEKKPVKSAFFVDFIYINDLVEDLPLQVAVDVMVAFSQIFSNPHYTVRASVFFSLF